MAALLCLLLLALAPGLALSASTDCRCAPAAPSAAVCGSDGATYDSKCALECARAGTNPGLSATHEGPCAAASNRTAVRDANQAITCTNSCVNLGASCIVNGCSSTDSQCRLRCANEVVRCGCACAAEVSSSRTTAAGRVLAAPEQAVEPLVLTLESRMTASGNHLLGEAADDVTRCFDDKINHINSCTRDCPNTPTSCRDDCVRTGLLAVCSCHGQSPSTTESPTDAIRVFEDCRSNCGVTGDTCIQNSCGGVDNSCSADCARNAARCTCGCTERLKQATSGVSSDASRGLLSGGRTSSLKTMAAPAFLRGAANDIIDCYTEAVTKSVACSNTCTTVACVLKCEFDSGEGSCRCGAAGLGQPLLFVLAVSALAWAFK